MTSRIFFAFSLLALMMGLSTQAQAVVSISPRATWHVQLDGTLKFPARQVYDIDLFDRSAATIASLKAQNRTVICYFSAGSYEDWRPDKAAFPVAALGKALDGWAGEKWLDIRNPGVMTVMKARLDLAKQKGCDGVDPDNVDGYTQNSGFTMTKQNQISYLQTLAAEAHARGLAIALKNGLEMIPAIVNDFDFAINESCTKYNECQMYAPFVNAGKAVFAIDYTTYSAKKCTKAKAQGINMQFYKQSLKAEGKPCPQ